MCAVLLSWLSLTKTKDTLLTETPSMKIFDPTRLTVAEFYRAMISVVAPRPIALVSTRAVDGTCNLSPFSYFNCFGANPPIAVFSVSTMEGGASKDTLRNMRETGECVIHIVDRPMADQMNLSSAMFAPDVDEFERSGLTPIPADLVKPARVSEAKIALECKMLQLIETGESRGAGNLVINQVVRLHVAEAILNGNGDMADPRKFRALARLGGEWYLESTPETLFELPRPPSGDAIGVAALLNYAPASGELTGNELGFLGMATELPDETAIQNFLAKQRTARNGVEPSKSECINLVREAIARSDLTEALIALAATRHI